MIGVKFTSAWVNPSGYGSSARTGITALFTSGINVTVETVSQMAEHTDYGITGSICKNLENRKIDYKINIIELTPDIIPQYKEKGIYTISRLYWETDKLPRQWIDPLNSIDEIWTASLPMVEMIKNSGVKTPTYCFPQPIDATRAFEKINPFTPNFTKDFTFYSMFQWILRKNPKGLLRAYWKEFQNDEPVTLVLKTYRITYTDNELRLIKEDIINWKDQMGLPKYPKIYLVHKLLTDPQISRLHAMGDCFINPSTGEGWNRPMEEAMLLGKPVISGDNGGITDIITPVNYYKVSSDRQQVEQVSWIPWYTSDMRWQVPDERELGKRMREVYENYKEAKKVAQKAQEYVINEFNFQTVGNQMKERLERISKTL